MQGTSRWAKAMHDTYPADCRLHGEVNFHYGMQNMAKAAGGWECRTCGLQCTPARKAAAARSKCHVVEERCAGQEDAVAQKWLASQRMLAVERLI